MTEKLVWQPEGLQGSVLFVPMSVEYMPVQRMLAFPEERQVLSFVGQVAGECYGSSIDNEACISRALKCVDRGHHSPFEHFNVTLRCVMDRGTSHAVVRHRHCAFQQSSTIYQNYEKTGHLTVCALPDVDPYADKEVPAMSESEIKAYELLALEYMVNVRGGFPPHRARDVLPNALATTLIITTNIREWMYIMQRRRGPGDAVRMHAFAWLVREWFKKHLPDTLVAFEQWYWNHPL